MEGLDLAMSILRSGMDYDHAVRATGLSFDEIKQEWDKQTLRGGSGEMSSNPFEELEMPDPRDPEALEMLDARKA